jgi:DNA-binding XRE family transcriptional regulator
MLAHIKTQTIGGLANINLTVPAHELGRIAAAIEAALNESGDTMRRLNEDGEELFTSDEVFPDAHPGMALQGLRVKEDLTQMELASRLGVKQHRVSEMETGKRPISVEMAKRIGQAFNISYKVFL